MKKLLFGLFTLVVACSVAAAPINISDDYVEPTTNADGTPLSDLSHMNFYCAVDGNPPTKGPDIPASSNIGGQPFSAVCSVTLSVGAEHTIEYWATATDLVGNESLDSGHTIVTKDFLPPAAPTQL